MGKQVDPQLKSCPWYKDEKNKQGDMYHGVARLIKKATQDNKPQGKPKSI